MTREPDFYKNHVKLNLGVIIQKNQIFGVPIGIAKMKKNTVPPRSTTDTISKKVI